MEHLSMHPAVVAVSFGGWSHRGLRFKLQEGGSGRAAAPHWCPVSGRLHATADFSQQLCQEATVRSARSWSTGVPRGTGGCLQRHGLPRAPHAIALQEVLWCWWGAGGAAEPGGAPAACSDSESSGSHCGKLSVWYQARACDLDVKPGAPMNRIRKATANTAGRHCSSCEMLQAAQAPLGAEAPRFWPAAADSCCRAGLSGSAPDPGPGAGAQCHGPRAWPRECTG